MKATKILNLLSWAKEKGIIHVWQHVQEQYRKVFWKVGIYNEFQFTWNEYRSISRRSCSVIISSSRLFHMISAVLFDLASGLKHKIKTRLLCREGNINQMNAKDRNLQIFRTFWGWTACIIIIIINQETLNFVILMPKRYKQQGDICFHVSYSFIFSI